MQKVGEQPLALEAHLAGSDTSLPYDPDVFLDKKAAHIRLETSVTEAIEQGRSLSIILGDLNAMKAVNDDIGHPQGDTILYVVENVLKVITATLRNQSVEDPRDPDIFGIQKLNFSRFEGLRGLAPKSTAGKLGGDEFIGIFPDTDEAGVLTFAERVQGVVKDHVDGSDGEVYREHGINVALGVGTATLTPEMTRGSDLLQVADANLYDNKISLMRPLSEEEVENVRRSLELLREANVRPRDIPRYIQWLSAQGIAHAFNDL